MELKKFDYDDCMREKLLRNIPPSYQKASGSILAAKRWLEEAERGVKNGTFISSVISSYLAMFHSSRSILFRDGFREKSHYCIARYLEEKYAKKGLLEMKWIEILDHSRETRHDSQYDVDFFATKEDAESSLMIAKEFVKRMEALLKQFSTLRKL